MAGKRDFIAEIKAYVERSALAKVNETAFDRISALIAAYQASVKRSNKKVRDELRRHIVVSLVALIQASARRTIAKIVDGKEEREEELPEPQDVKITLAMIRELKKREFSVGELIAHFSPLGGFEQVSSALQRVSGEDLNTILLNSLRKDTLGIEGSQKPEDALANIRSQLVKLFYYRNIYCHEEGFGISVTDGDVVGFLGASFKVVAALQFLTANT